MYVCAPPVCLVPLESEASVIPLGTRVKMVSSLHMGAEN